MAKEYKSTWQEREERLERNKSKVNKSKNDFFNSSAPELNGVWEQYDCEKCYSRFDCKYKGQGLTHVCSNWFKDSSEHDKKVWDSAIDEFVKVIDLRIDTLIEKEWMHNVAKKLKEQTNET